MGQDQEEFKLTFSKTSYGKHAPVTISFCITSIGTPEAPEYDLYPVEFESEGKKLYFPEWAFSADDEQFKGDNGWVWFGGDNTVLADGDLEDDPKCYQVKFDKMQLRTFVNEKPMGLIMLGGPNGGTTMFTENWRYD